MEATDKETAGQEAEEEPEEGIYVFIKKHSFKQTRWLLIFTIFYLPFIWKPFFSLPVPREQVGVVSVSQWHHTNIRVEKNSVIATFNVIIDC